MPPLQIEISSGSLLAAEGGPFVVALPVRPADGDRAAEIDDPEGIGDELGIDIEAAVQAEQASGDAGSVVSIPVGHDGVERLLLVGIGDGSTAAMRKATAAVVRRSRGAEAIATVIGAGLEDSGFRAMSEAAGLAVYHFDQRSQPKPPKLARLVIGGVAKRRISGASEAVRRGSVIAAAVSTARDLSNMPSMVKSPDWLAKQARKLCTQAGVGVLIRDEKQLAAEGFGGILGVGAGSAQPPRLVEMTWSPEGAKRHIVLIGKGITFDSGGLSLKPTDGMVSMKTDMAGGAAVIATMTALRDLGVTARVTGLVPMAENMLGANATRPGDVLRHWDGQTSEVLNTDAEGRLVLADALSYAAAELKPDALIDIATLTGAASLGLGKRHAAFYATTPRLRDDLVAAGASGGEALWPMPLVEDYRDSLESPIADLRNIGDPGLHYSAGSIVAALFLREFTGGLPWAHLDIAGVGRSDSDDGEISKGATGFGVRTFLRYLESL